MQNNTLSTVVILCGALLATACTTEIPKCSDESTLELVRKILLSHMGLGPATPEMLASLKFEYPHATALDEKIKKYACETKLIAGGTYQLPITYESQLDDRNDHLVSVGGMSRLDVQAVEQAIREQVQKQGAARVAAAPAPAMPFTGNVPQIAGIWRGKLEGDGEMRISVASGGFDVVLDVATEGCAGNIEGIAQLAGNTLTLSREEEGQACTITAVFDNDRVTLSEDNCMYYHGPACGFDGTLRRAR